MNHCSSLIHNSHFSQYWKRTSYKPTSFLTDSIFLIKFTPQHPISHEALSLRITAIDIEVYNLHTWNLKLRYSLKWRGFTCSLSIPWHNHWPIDEFHAVSLYGDYEVAAIMSLVYHYFKTLECQRTCITDNFICYYIYAAILSLMRSLLIPAQCRIMG